MIESLYKLLVVFSHDAESSSLKLLQTLYSVPLDYLRDSSNVTSNHQHNVIPGVSE